MSWYLLEYVVLGSPRRLAYPGHGPRLLYLFISYGTQYMSIHVNTCLSPETTTRGGTPAGAARAPDAVQKVNRVLRKFCLNDVANRRQVEAARSCVSTDHNPPLL